MEERFQTFTVLITKINRCIRKIKAEEVDELNIKGPHVSCIYYIYKFGALTAKELCDICQEDKASISRSIEYLENSGYISCDSTQRKRYNSSLILTNKGEKAAKVIANKVDKIVDIASSGLTEEKRKILYESLTLISDNLESFCKNYEGE